MAQGTLRGPAALAPAANTWKRISPSIVPIFAVITALVMSILITIFITFLTTGSVNLGFEFQRSIAAYSALLEGATGLAYNNQVSANDVALVENLTRSESLSRRDVSRLERSVADYLQMGPEQVQRYQTALTTFGDLDDEQLGDLASRIADIQRLTPETLRSLQPLVAQLIEADRGEVRSVAENVALEETLTPENRAEVEALAPAAADYSDEDLYNAMRIVNDEGVVKLDRLLTALETLESAQIAPDSAEASDLASFVALGEGAEGIEAAREMTEIATRLEAANVSDAVTLDNQLQLVNNLYDEELLTNEDVATALNTELPAAVQNNLIVNRPGNRLLVDRGSADSTGVIYVDTLQTPDNSADDIAEAVYLRLGSGTLVFFPAQLESTIIRSIPFVIAGLAVALGFKAGLFNIGAEGQLYAGGVLAVWVGFSPLFAGLPAIIHVPLVILVGILGGAIWGSIPGILKAYTGAHEVINTIMLNFIAVRLVDWLIKSTNPVILLDPAASTPRTPFILENARIPTFAQISPVWFVIVGLLMAGLWLWGRRERIQQDARFAIRPVVMGLLIIVAGFFLQAISVRGNLHLGLVIMLVAVWFTDWFLTRTTLGFELRTVGANPDAARYAGMNVQRNIILALTMSGALAGLAGMIEISGVVFSMQPAFFSGLGFDAIAVALLARTNPRNMIIAGFLWGGLLSGAGLMQVRADISIDLVKIIQALIIMFIAADVIIRYLWRVPEATPEEKAAATFSKGWGG
jgi:general nucleoside transport system permease protein